jgi:hypothetical protein
MKGYVIIMLNNKNLTPEEKAEKDAKFEETCNKVILAGSAGLMVACAGYMTIHCIKALAGTENNNTNAAFNVAGGIN